MHVSYINITVIEGRSPDMKRVEVIIIGGFLGVGKTTSIFNIALD